MTIEEYYEWFRVRGFEPTGDGTILTEAWTDGHKEIMISRPDMLTENERALAIARYRLYLGPPSGGAGVH